ncbi:MAG: tryptophan--tRNA ligase [Candidatus Saccharimonadales bacterium]
MSTTAKKQVMLTGIKPTGRPHIGNFLGAIEPGLRRSQKFDRTHFFIADYHALNSLETKNDVSKLTLSVAASWLAAGLDPDKINFYRQSDIPEIFELVTILNNYTPKGWMNKAHAYKAKVDINTKAGKEIDEDINMGLYSYPLLMASDILLFDAGVVPVGKDQMQHIEITRDIAARFNNSFGEIFTLPEYLLEDKVEELPGVDGRKMSKSYDNIIPLFAGSDEWWESIRKIVTDSSPAGGQIKAEDSVVFKIYEAIASEADSNSLRSDLESGTIGWKEAKEKLLEAIEARFSDMSKNYQELITNPDDIKQVLEQGASKVRPLAAAKLTEVKAAIGINS